jgi:hypothetical protein
MVDMQYLLPLLGIVSLTALSVSPTSQSAPAARLLFNRDVRPILSEHCFACHGPDKAKRKGKFRLDERDSALTRQVIVPGKPGESKLVERINSADESEVMPPPEMHKPLSAAQKKLLTDWITQGAEYQPHWAYIVPTRPTVPPVKQAAWVRNPIDAFILAALEAKGIAPSPEADRATLLRRLSLDLTGLPPTWEETTQTGKSVPQDMWYEQAVDRLLASPAFGERMAVHWLDLVRFADTVGYHGDQNQRIFPYRDYVINAFNSNMPFDQFTREQLAGDLLPNSTVQQKVASGFNRLNMMTREGGAQPGEYLAKYAADRVRTVAGTWLGSTIGCAECHDHKYDPFTSKDFYSLAAYFGDIKQWGVYNDYSYTPNPDLRGWSNDHPFPPEIQVESPYLQQRMTKLKKQMDEVAGPASEAVNQWAHQLSLWQKKHGGWWMTPAVEVGFGAMPAPRKKTNAKPAEKTTKAAEKATKPSEKKKDDTAKVEKKTDEKPKPQEKADVQPDGSILFSGPMENAPKISLKLPAGPIALVKLELLGSDGKSILRSNSGSLSFKPTFELRRAGEEKAKALAIRHADADRKEPIYRNGHDLIGIRDSWKLSLKARNEKHTSLWWLDQPFTANTDDELIISIPTNQLRHIKLSVSPYAPLDFPLEVTPEFTPSSYLRSTAHDAARYTELKRLDREYHECRHGKTMTMVTEALAKPAVTRVLPRGNFLDQTGAVVQPTPPSFLQAKAGTSRLDLANWLVSKDNPLTARVVVNRFWKMLFGNGLSNVLDDLGAQGEWPTHPELLDWLAVEFRESGWNVKHLLKLMVMSNTYRQSAVTRLDLKEIDPGNRLLAAQNPRRLDAEFVRDQALAVAGLLNRDLGGPSCFPYQPSNYYSLLQFPDRDYKAQLDERQYRRGLYTHWQRMFPQPMLANFDAPSREECTACRVVANTPQQALTLLNDPSFVEAARVLAAYIISRSGDDQAKVTEAFRRVLQREPKPKELAGLVTLLGKQREYYRSQPEEATALLKVGQAPLPTGADTIELSAWTNTVRVLFNLHETITRY